MTEEAVTRSLLRALEDAGWTIVAFDYPGSGTGRLVRPLGSQSKNVGGVIPDVIATRGAEAIWVECKDRLSRADLRKLREARENERLWSALGVTVGGLPLRAGLGMPLACLPAGVPEGADFTVGTDGHVFVVRGEHPPLP